jgi:cytochrome c oxidase assembly protein subunit 15
MIVIGGLTRLTESGLSIVEWKLLSGTLPPLTQAGWEEEFAAYQTSPEYLHKNYGMTLPQFKGIFWLEYLHRLLGRVIGLAFILPLLFLWMRRGTAPFGPDGFRGRMTLIAALVGLQGTVGWYMVKSGLVDVPWVSPYRLALHLSLAVSIFGLLLATYLRLRPAIAANNTPASLHRLSRLTLAALFMQIVLGAFVAGLDAGMTYNTFPLMDGDFIPMEMRALEPSLRHYLENVASVQFLHRWWAFAVAALTLLLAGRVMTHSSTSREQRILAAFMMLAVLAQMALGIATLLLVVPVGLATLHQAMAVLLFGLVLWLNDRLSHAKMRKTHDHLISVNHSPSPA